MAAKKPVKVRKREPIHVRVELEFPGAIWYVILKKIRSRSYEIFFWDRRSDVLYFSGSRKTLAAAITRARSLAAVGDEA